MVPPRRHPGPHPPPPSDLSSRRLSLTPVARPLFRIHASRHRPLYFGSSGDNRFDDPLQAYGVLYAGLSAACAFIETFSDPLDYPFVTETQLAQRKLTRIEVRAPLLLVDLRGSHLRRLGADARLFAGDHAPAQLWSRAFFAHPAQPDGLLYRARHDAGEYAVALFDRAKRSMRPQPMRATLSSPANRSLIAGLLAKYGLGLVP
ncbi:MAG: hypothetical protein A2V77_15230 [Anaeromyxobacter sp. RBG_16_69_14]|nr:MAG: hypothetical protein A2V77_15230 [Anaeromyxobacter sp. RBG_16_69_14]